MGKIKNIITVLFFFTVAFAHAQQQIDSLHPVFPKQGYQNPIRKYYDLSEYELILSGGQVSDSGRVLVNMPRASLAVMYHANYNFGKHTGIYSGLGVRNIGFINQLPVPNQKDAIIKQRSWALGIPIALKLGNMGSGTYFAIGAEEEWMFNYKEKVFFDGHKSKHSEWTSTDVNNFMPSAFMEFHFLKSFFVRCRYYPTDFLTNQNSLITLPKTSTQVNYTPTNSTMFYISVGVTEL